MQLFVITLLTLAVASVTAHPISTADAGSIAIARLTSDRADQYVRAADENGPEEDMRIHIYLIIDDEEPPSKRTDSYGTHM